MTRPAELIVPIRDRRKRRRILTLKNFRKVIIAIAIFFLGVTIQSDFRHSNGDHYGRLFAKQVSSQTAITPKKYETVPETRVEDQTAADPLLLSAAAREQYLRGETTAIVHVTQTDSVSGPNGIVITRTKPEQSHPTLSGGIFRQ